jgi:hypothetical protein
MERGMLWFDNNPKTDIKTKVQLAADYYQKKFGRFPDLCFVHPSELSRETVTENKITIRPYRPVLPGHLWIGLSESKAA